MATVPAGPANRLSAHPAAQSATRARASAPPSNRGAAATHAAARAAAGSWTRHRPGSGQSPAAALPSPRPPAAAPGAAARDCPAAGSAQARAPDSLPVHPRQTHAGVAATQLVPGRVDRLTYDATVHACIQTEQGIGHILVIP